VCVLVPHDTWQMYIHNQISKYCSPKIEYRDLVENDKSSPLGMFLSEAVDKGETLMLITKKCLFTMGKSPAESTDTCDTVKNLAHHHELGESSEFYPYVNYCLASDM